MNKLLTTPKMFLIVILIQVQVSMIQASENYLYAFAGQHCKQYDFMISSDDYWNRLKSLRTEKNCSTAAVIFCDCEEEWCAPVVNLPADADICTIHMLEDFQRLGFVYQPNVYSKRQQIFYAEQVDSGAVGSEYYSQQFELICTEGGVLCVMITGFLLCCIIKLHIHDGTFFGHNLKKLLFPKDRVKEIRGCIADYQLSEGSQDENIDIESFSNCYWLPKWQISRLCWMEPFQYVGKEDSVMDKHKLVERRIHGIVAVTAQTFVSTGSEVKSLRLQQETLEVTFQKPAMAEVKNLRINAETLKVTAQTSNGSEVQNVLVKIGTIDITAQTLGGTEVKDFGVKKGSWEVAAQPSVIIEVENFRVNVGTEKVTAKASTSTVEEDLTGKEENIEVITKANDQAEVSKFRTVEEFGKTTTEASHQEEVENCRAKCQVIGNEEELGSYDDTIPSDELVKEQYFSDGAMIVEEFGKNTTEASHQEEVENCRANCQLIGNEEELGSYDDTIPSDELVKEQYFSDGAMIVEEFGKNTTEASHQEEVENCRANCQVIGNEEELGSYDDTIPSDELVMEQYFSDGAMIVEEFGKTTTEASHQEEVENCRAKCQVIGNKEELGSYDDTVPTDELVKEQYFEDGVKIDDLEQPFLQAICKSQGDKNEDRRNDLCYYQDIHKGKKQQNESGKILELVKIKKKQSFRAKGIDARDRIVTTAANLQWLKKNPDSDINLSFRGPALSEEKDKIAPCLQEHRKWAKSHPSVSGVEQEFTLLTSTEESGLVATEEPFNASSQKCKERNANNSDNLSIITEIPSDYISLESEKKKKALCSKLHFRITDNPSSFISLKNNKKNVEDKIHLKEKVKLFSYRKQVISSSVRAFFETEDTSPDQKKDCSETDQQIPSDMDLTVQKKKCGVEIDQRTVTDIDLKEKKKHHLRQIVWLPRNWLPLPRLGRDAIVAFVEEQTRDGHGGSTLSPAGHEELREVLRQLASDNIPGPQITMKYEMLRLGTMKNFPGQDRPFAIRIIGAGFYYAGHEDQVICYCCGYRKDSWVLGDIPLLIHQKMAPDCGFLTHNAQVNVPIRTANSTELPSLAEVRLLAIQRSDWANQSHTAQGELSLMLSSSKQNQINISNMPHQMLVTNKSSTPNQLMASGRQNVLDNRRIVSAHTDSIEEPPPKYPQYAELSVELRQKPEEMAEYGFNDAASTPSPGNAEIQKFLLTDAAQSVLDMGYQPKLVLSAIERVLPNKGTEELTGQIIMQAVFEIEEENKAQPEPQTSTQSAERNESSGKAKMNSEATNKQNGQLRAEVTENASSEELQIDPEKIMREHRELREATLCTICLENTVSVVFLPCGHLVTCIDCAPAMRKCPICRALIKGTVKYVSLI